MFSEVCSAHRTYTPGTDTPHAHTLRHKPCSGPRKNWPGMILLCSYVARGHRITLESEEKWTQRYPQLECRRQARGPRNQEPVPQAGFYNSVQDSHPTATKNRHHILNIEIINKYMNRFSTTWDTISNSWKWQNLQTNARHQWRCTEMGLLIHYLWEWEFNTIEQKTIHLESNPAICIESVKGF